MTFDSHCIYSNLTLKDALVVLNILRNTSITLFVFNNYVQIIGTLTDGDILRASGNGHGLYCRLDEVMHCDFSFVCQ